MLVQERKYFDSGDYALSKAGKATDGDVTSIGSQHPLPENIPHLSSPGPNAGSLNGNSASGNGLLPSGTGGSPVKESSFLHRETSIDENGNETQVDQRPSVSPGREEKAIPVRWQT